MQTARADLPYERSVLQGHFRHTPGMPRHHVTWHHLTAYPVLRVAEAVDAHTRLPTVQLTPEFETMQRAVEHACFGLPQRP